MEYLLLGVCVLQLPVVLIVLCDLILNKIHDLKRYHIGRWKNQEEWASAVKKCAGRWLLNPPVVSAVDNGSHRFLKGQAKANATIQSWQTAGLALGLMAVCDTDQDKELLNRWKEQLIEPQGRWKKTLSKVDWAMLGYAVLKQSGSDCSSVKLAADQVLLVLLDNLCSDGMISYSQGKSSTVRYVDTLGMVCPFLALYGKMYDRPDVAMMAVAQLEKFHKSGLYLNTSLPCHAYDASNGLPLGIYGWGRGTAWYIIALLDTWRELPDGPDRIKINVWLQEAAESYMQYQKQDGAYFTILQGGGQYDSSATAAMAYFYHECAAVFDDERYAAVSQRCLNKLMRVTMRNGAVDQCQGDTHGIGIFSQNFDIMPFVQGLVLRTLG